MKKKSKSKFFAYQEKKTFLSWAVGPFKKKQQTCP